MSISEKRLVPSAATQFPGSFAPNLREDSRKSAPSRGWRSVLYSYITDAWDDISVWKSAVSVPLVDLLRLSKLTGFPVHRARWYSINDLSFCHDSYHDWQFPNIANSTIRWNHEYLPPKPVHRGFPLSSFSIFEVIFERFETCSHLLNHAQSRCTSCFFSLNLAKKAILTPNSFTVGHGAVDWWTYQPTHYILHDDHRLDWFLSGNIVSHGADCRRSSRWRVD